MTTPNGYTRLSLVDIAGRTTHSLADLERVLPHMRAVANAATGLRQLTARRAVQEAELLAEQFREADRRAEAVKTLFRSATVHLRHTPGDTPSLTADSPATQTPGGGAASLVRRQV